MRHPNDKNEKPASELKNFAKEHNLSITVLEMDVTSDESVKAAGNQISKVDVLINNAGIGYGGPIESFSSSEVMALIRFEYCRDSKNSKSHTS